MRKSTQAMLILGALAGIAMQGNSFPTESRELRIEPSKRNRSERRAEERKAAAEAKRQRKAAKRAAELKGDGSEGAQDAAPLKRYGYAPGDYTAECHACGQTFEGADKRATTCRGCARKAAKRAAQANRSQS